MEQSILLDRYELHWKSKSQTSFISEVYHFIKNNSGGCIKTPIGIMLGFLEKLPSRWTIKLILRDNIYYSSSENKITVIVKSAYRNKLNFYFDKQKLKSNNLPIELSFPNEVINYLISEKICYEPLTLEVSTETIKQFEQRGGLTLDDFD